MLLVLLVLLLKFFVVVYYKSAEVEYMGQVYIVRLGLTLGIVYGVSILLLSLVTKESYGGVMFRLLEGVYPGCDRTTQWGKLLCGGMAFLDGFLGGVLFGIMYNILPVTF